MTPAARYTPEPTGQTQAQPNPAAQRPTQPRAAGTAATDTRPGGGLGVPVDPEGTNDPWAKYKWWILGGLALLLAGRSRHHAEGLLQAPQPPPLSAATGPPTSRPAVAPATTGNSLLAALKDELFALETDHVQGRLTDNQYSEQKAALEVVLKRALARTEAA